MFTKRTIRPEHSVTHVDTPAEALAVSIGERGRVDLPYMSELLGTPGDYERITSDLQGVIFKDPSVDTTDPEAGWQTADEYLSGNVRQQAADCTAGRPDQPGVCTQRGSSDQSPAQGTGSL